MARRAVARDRVGLFVMGQAEKARVQSKRSVVALQRRNETMVRAELLLRLDRGKDQQILAVLDAVSDGVAVVDLDLALQYVNQTFMNLAGWQRPEDMIGRHVSHFVTEETLLQLKDQLPPLLSGQRIRFEGVGRTASGGLILIDIGGSVLRDGDGQPYGFVATVRDISRSTQVEEALRASEIRYRTLVQQLPHKIFHKDRESVYVSCNEAYAQDLGIPPEQITGKTDFDFYPGELAEKYRADDRRVMELGHTVEIEEEYIEHGQARTVSTVKTPLHDDEGQVVGVLGIFSDITERKRTEQALRESTDQLQAIYDGIADGLLVAELDTGRIVRVSPAACAMFGYSKPEFLEKRVSDLHPAASLTQVMAEFHAQAKGEKVVASGLPCARKDGSIFFADIASQPIIYAGKGCLVGFFRDITERKQAEEALDFQARHDSLTGLLNRQELRKRLIRQLASIGGRRKGKLAMLFLDLDRFKLINDTYGHETGDQVLIQMGERMKSCLREDDLLARMGGDEFAVLLPSVAKAADADKVATRLLQELLAPVEVGSHKLTVGVSIGIALFPDNGADAESLMSAADAAMYAAKEAGRNRYPN